MYHPWLAKCLPKLFCISYSPIKRCMEFCGYQICDFLTAPKSGSFWTKVMTGDVLQQVACKHQLKSEAFVQSSQSAMSAKGSSYFGGELWFTLNMELECLKCLGNLASGYSVKRCRCSVLPRCGRTSFFMFRLFCRTNHHLEAVSEYAASTSGRQAEDILPKVARQALDVLGRERYLRFQQFQNEIRRQRQLLTSRFHTADNRLATVSRPWLNSIFCSGSGQV